MVFLESDRSHPVQAIFKVPMLLDRLEKLICPQFEVTDVTALLCPGLAVPHAPPLKPNQALPSRPVALQQG